MQPSGSANKKAKRTSRIERSTPQRGAGSLVLPVEELLKAYRGMLQARLADEKTIVLYKQNKCYFQIGVAGHEAVQVAAAHVFHRETDWFYPYYRDLAICMALGMTEREIMLNAMNKQEDPNSHGRQMPVHYGKRDLHIMNQSSPTGSQYLPAVGCALGLRLRKEPGVVYVSSGEGACAQGDFHEAVNWAAREKLPVLFLVENNKYAISTLITDELAGASVYKIAQGYENLHAFEVDGTDYSASYEVLQKAYALAASGAGPALVDAHVVRLQSHSISDNQAKYRSQEEISADKEHCPILTLRRFLTSHELASESQLQTIEDEVKSAINAASEWAEQQPDPTPEDVLTEVYADPNPAENVVEQQPDGEEVYLVDALNHALDEEMERNPQMCIFGQDVAGGKGGVFTVTAGLTAKYGQERVFNAPLAESSIAGVAVGMAMLGLKPVAEIQFGDYVWTAMNQIRNEIAIIRYRSAGDFSCPAVIRIPVGGYIRGGCYHSQNIEATFAHFPGLFVIYPSNATDAKGLLKSAIRGKDPVLFLEHKGLYRQVYAKGKEGNADFLTPIGRAKVVHEGTDATVITWGALVHKTLAAVAELEKDGKSVEVVDLRTIVPLDLETVFESVKKTNRVLVAHEDMVFMGFGAEVAAQIGEHCFKVLDAPVKRLGAKNVSAVPHAPILESAVLPQHEDIMAALRELLAL